jgi:uncharacterized protein
VSNYYFDASAIVKRYAIEPGTGWVRQLCAALDSETDERWQAIFVGEISRVEVAAALAQKVRWTGEISEQDAEDAIELFVKHLDEEYQIVLMTSELIRSAAVLAQQHALRAYDAVQLAAALRTNSLLLTHDLALIFVSGDANLLQAARAEGMATENPFHHSDLDTTR